MSESNSHWIERSNQVFINTYSRFPAVLVKGQGCRVEDADGNKKYFTEIKIDFGGKIEMLDSKEGAKTAGEHIKETHPELPQAEPISGKAVRSGCRPVS